MKNFHYLMDQILYQIFKIILNIYLKSIKKQILKTFGSEISYIRVCFKDQNSNPLEIKDKINITLVIN